jgi:hypothetical protein
MVSLWVVFANVITSVGLFIKLFLKKRKKPIRAVLRVQNNGSATQKKGLKKTRGVPHCGLAIYI